MSYTPSTDFIALLRQTTNGLRFGRLPGLDFTMAALSRAGMFLIVTSQTAPVINQGSTVWLKPASPNSWSAEATVLLYNTDAGEYEPATPELWAALLNGSAAQVVQEVTTPGPVNILFNAGIVRVNQAISAPITLVMPLSTVKIGNVLVSDWKGDSGANPILVQMSGADKLPGNRTDWTIQGDGGSLMFRIVPGGFVI